MTMLAEATPTQILLAKAHAERMARLFPVRRKLAPSPPLIVNIEPAPRAAVEIEYWPDTPLSGKSHWRRILVEVMEKHHVNLRALRSNMRMKSIVVARHEAYYRIGHETTLSLPQIGERMNRDHSTIIHGIRKHASRNDLPNMRTA